jgi:hypothetical protein
LVENYEITQQSAIFWMFLHFLSFNWKWQLIIGNIKTTRTIQATMMFNNAVVDAAVSPNNGDRNRNGTKRWNANSPAGQLLQQLIMSGALDPKLTGSQVQNMYQQFREYDSNSFGQNLRRARIAHSQSFNIAPTALFPTPNGKLLLRPCPCD